MLRFKVVRRGGARVEWKHFIGGWRIKDLEKQRNNGVGPNRNSMGHCAQGNSACYAVGQKEKRKGKGKVRRLDRATYKAVQAKGIKSFRRDFNQDPGELAETRVG